MKNKILTLSLCMLLSLSACGSQQPDIRGSVSSLTEAEESTPEKENIQSPGVAAQDDASSQEGTDADPSGKDSSESDETTGVSLGHSAGNVYENTFIGIGCKLGPEWIFLSDEEIQDVNKISGEMIGGEYKKALEQATTLTDMIARHEEKPNTLNVSMEKLGLTYLTMSAEQYAELAKDSLITPLKTMGLENVTAENSTIQFLGAECPCVKIYGTYQGRECHELMVPYKCSGYMAVITACTWDENTTADLITSFYGLD